jgi:hypothetical protein
MNVEQLLANASPALLLQPYIMQVVDNKLNEMAVRLGPHPIHGIQFRYGQVPPHCFCNAQWPSYDGQATLSKSCRVYMTRAA